LPIHPESGISPATGAILLVAITIALAMIVLLMFSFPDMDPLKDPDVPVIFEITEIRDTNPQGVVNHDSFMKLVNIGTRAYDNRKLYAKTYRNGVLLPCMIPFINFNDFIDVHPNGIETIGGPGTGNYHWNPGAEIFVDYSDGTFRPGNVVTFEVYNRTNNRIISRDIYPHTKGSTEKWMRLLFSHPGV
jgi:flagellin-like protein